MDVDQGINKPHLGYNLICGKKKMSVKSNGTPNAAFESSEITHISKKTKMESSGGTWLQFRISAANPLPPTNPGRAK